MMYVRKKQRLITFATTLFFLSLLLSLFMTKQFAHAEENIFAGGDGTAESPYLIETAEQLDKVRENLTAHYKLGDDIDLSGYENWEPIGKRGAAFQGTFDGDGHAIKNLKIGSTQEDHIGLFGYVLSTREVTPVIKNVHLENVILSTGENIGGLVGFIDTRMYENDEGDRVHPNPTIVSDIIVNGQVHQGLASNGGTNGTGLLIGKAINVDITNAKATGYVRGSYRIGGLIGYAPRQTSIKNSSFSGDVDGYMYYIGGLVGRLGSGSTVIGSSSEGSVFGTSTIGGITGYMSSGIISESYSTSYVEAKENWVGGLVGRFDPNTSDPLIITKSFATGDVRGTSSVGGLIGNTYHLSRAMIENTFATGNVTGTGNTVGGLIGMHDYGHLKNSYAIGRVISDEGRTPGGLVGSVGNSPTVSGSYYNTETSGQNDDEGKGIPTSDAAMKNQDTFEGWDFNNVWRIDPNSDYPYPTFDFTSHVPDFSQQGDVVYVKEGALGKGHSWDSPLGNLEIALLMAERDENIKEIWIAEGTYVPMRKSIAANGNTLTRNEFRHFHMVNDVAIYGGFPASGNPDFTDRDPTAYETILSGDIYRNDDGSEPSKSDNVHHVFYHKANSGIDDTAVLDGVTITGGSATGLSEGRNHGGGMYNEQASPTLRNVVFTDNHANMNGGAMYNTGSSPSLENVTFESNTAYWGAGIHNLNSSPTITNTKFIDNEASSSGGGFYNSSPNAKPVLTDVVFTGNKALYGGGFYNENGAHPTLINVVFQNNNGNYGGAFTSYPGYSENTAATFQNVELTKNHSANSHGAIMLAGKGVYDFKNLTVTANEGSGLFVTSYNGKSNIPEVTIHNSILWGNETENVVNNDNANLLISNSLIGGSGGSDNWNESLGDDGGNNLDEDPLFVGNGDYTLQEGSPAIDAGNNDYILDGVTTDLIGTDRILNDTVDLGAYENDKEPKELPTIDHITVEPNDITIQVDADEIPFEVMDELDLNEIQVRAFDVNNEEINIKGNPIYTIDDELIAQVNNDKIVAKSAGKTVLTVHYEDKTAEVDIEVKSPPVLQGISMIDFSYGHIRLEVDELFSLDPFDSNVTAQYVNIVGEDDTVTVGLKLSDLEFIIEDETIVGIVDNNFKGKTEGSSEVTLFYQDKGTNILISVSDDDQEVPVDPGDPKPIETDFSSLEGLYADFIGASQGNYTDESWAALTRALADAEVLLYEARENATQEEVDTAFDNLLAAIDGLEEENEDPTDPTDPEPTEVDFASLEGLYADFVESSQDNYTDESWAALTQALVKAEAILSNRRNATQEEVDTAFDNLLAAIDGLEEENEDPTDPTDTEEPEEGEDPTDSTVLEPKHIDIVLGKTYDVHANDTIIIQVDDTNTTIEMPDYLPEGTKAIVEDARNRSNATSAGNLIIAGDVFDVTIFGPNNEKVYGPFVLTMGYDIDSFNANEVAIYYYDEDQDIWIKQDGTVNEDEGTVTVVVDHFSMYGVFAERETSSDPGEIESEDPQIEDQAVNDDDVIIDSSESGSTLPKTATNTFNMIVIGLVLLVLGGIAFIVIRRKLYN